MRAVRPNNFVCDDLVAENGNVLLGNIRNLCKGGGGYTIII